MSKFFKNLWIRLKWILRKCSRKTKRLQKADTNKKSNPIAPPHKIQLDPNKSPQKTTSLQQKKKSLWKLLLKLTISLTELFRLFRLLISLIRKSLDGSGKN